MENDGWWITSSRYWKLSKLIFNPYSSSQNAKSPGNNPTSIVESNSLFELYILTRFISVKLEIPKYTLSLIISDE